MTATYQARLFERDGTLGPLLNVVPTYGRALNARGTCSFTTKIDEPGLTADNTRPWANEVALLRSDDGVTVVHDGPIIKRSFDVDQRQVTFTVGTVAAWLGRRNKRRTVVLNHTATDLDTIARDIITKAQQPAGTYDADADFGVTTSANPTGDTIDLASPASDRRNWLELLTELAEGNPGFDFDFTTTVTAGVRARAFEVWSPGRGSAVTTRLILGNSMVGLEVDDDGERAANHIESFGTAGTPSAVYASSSQDVYGVLELMDTGNDLTTLNALNRRAAEQRRLRLPNPRIVKVGYKVGTATPFRFATLGDTVPLEADLGILSLSGSYRIVAEDVTVTAGGGETVMLTFQDPLA